MLFRLLYINYRDIEYERTNRGKGDTHRFEKLPYESIMSRVLHILEYILSLRLSYIQPSKR